MQIQLSAKCVNTLILLHGRASNPQVCYHACHLCHCTDYAFSCLTLHAVQVELAQYAHLCTIMSNMHHRRAGYPFGTIVDFASDGAGCPLFCLSPLAIHTRNIMEDPRCSLVVQMPGWTGMANARVTIFGDVYQLPPDMHEAAREVLSCMCTVAISVAVRCRFV